MDQRKSLVALFLALGDSTMALTDDQAKALAEVGEQLAANPKAWDSHIAPRLQAAVELNPELKAKFQGYQGQLEALPGELEPDWLPQAEELDAVVPVPVGMVAKGFPPAPVDTTETSEEINNIAVRLLTQPKPEEAVKKLNAFQRLKGKLQ